MYAKNVTICPTQAYNIPAEEGTPCSCDERKLIHNCQLSRVAASRLPPDRAGTRTVAKSAGKRGILALRASGGR